MDPDLIELLGFWLSDTDPGDERRTAILNRLRDDADFRKSFVDEIQLLGKLKAVQSAEPRWLLLEDRLGWSAPTPVSIDDLVNRVLDKGKQQVRRRYLRKRLAQLSLGATAAMVMLVSLIGWYNHRFPLSLDSDLPPQQPFVQVAKIIKLDSIVWEKGNLYRVGESVPRSRMKIRSGQASLTMVGGAVVTVEGPADIDLLSADRIFCHQGKIRTRVPPGAEGFTIVSPGLEVVDLGTEFGFNLGDDGKSQVMVFEGETAISVLGEDGRTIQSTVLEQKRAVEIDPKIAKIQEVVPAPDAYVRFPILPQNHLLLSPQYREEVLHSNPWGYWRFESMKGKSIPNEIHGRPALRAIGSVTVDGIDSNRSALFQPGDSQQALIMEETFTPPRADGYAIELWVRSESVRAAALASLISVEKGQNEMHVALLELTARSQQSLSTTCAVRFLDRWPPGLVGGTNALSRRTYLPDQWHHLVGQRRGDTVEIYIDGELVASSPVNLTKNDPNLSTGPCKLLLGRLKQVPLPTKNDENRSLDGRIDEVALYDHPLNSEEIRRHFLAQYTVAP
jgi:hypothetical protein